MQKNLIVNDSGQRLALLESVPADAHHILVACHGFRGAKENRGRIFSLAEKLNPKGFGVIAFDFAGSGESEGSFAEISLTSQVLDLKRVLRYTEEKFSRPVILLGRSFGGSTVIAGGYDAEVVGFILWCTPINLPATFRAILPDVYDRLGAGEYVSLEDEAGSFVMGPALVKDFAGHDFDAYLKGIGNRPVLAVHGLKDEIVSPDSARYIAEHLPEAELKLFPETDHKFTEYAEERESVTVEWLQRSFAK